MTILSAIVENSFKKAEDGKDLFYPYGVLGKGRIVPSERERTKISKFLKTYYLVAMVLNVLVAVLLGVLFLIPVLIATLGAYYIFVNKLVRNLEVSQIKFSTKESMQKAAKNYGPGIIIFGLIIGMVLLLVGLIMLFRMFFVDPSINAVTVVSLVCIGIFVVFIYLRLLVLSRK